MVRYFTLFIALFFCTFSAIAQTAEGCDGSRYIDDVFSEVVVTTSIEYATGVPTVSGGMTNLFMDIYEPADDSQEKRPAIVLAHGGSFLFGARGDMQSFCETFARKGYVAITMDYRLWPVLTQGFPDSTGILGIVVGAVHDMKGAVRFLRADAATTNTFKIDPEQILVGGLSAGGIIATHVGMMDETDDIPPHVQEIIDEVGLGLEGASGSMGYSSDIQGILNLSGGLYLSSWVDSDDAPILSMHGTSDETVPYNQGLAAGIMSINGSGNVHLKAEAAGIRNHLITVEGGGHTDIYTEAAFVDAQELLNTEGMAFLESLLCNLTSAKDIDASIAVTIAPNPATDIATVQVPNYTGTYDVLVYDQMGRLVNRQTNQGDSFVELSKQTIGTGLFFVQIRLADGTGTIAKSVVFE